MSRTALKSLGATLDFKNDKLQLFGRQVPVQVNQAGQYVVNLVTEELASDLSETEIGAVEACTSEDAESAETSESDVSHDGKDHIVEDVVQDPSAVAPSFAPEAMADSSKSHESEAAPAEAEARTVMSWFQEDSGVKSIPWLAKDGPKWKHVIRRVVRLADTGKIIADHQFAPNTQQKNTIVPLQIQDDHVITEFIHVTDPEQPFPRRNTIVTPMWKPSKKESRRLLKQASVSHEVCAAGVNLNADRIRLMEVFSPPRFAPVVEKLGYKARSYDLKTGYDLSRSEDRRKVEADLIRNCPDLLTLSPPCTDEGGWFYLNGSKMDRLEYLRRRIQSRSFIRWCCKLFRMQTDRGGRVVFEHPTGAMTWTYPEVQALLKKFTTVKLHMCRYGLRLPQSERLIRKSTRLLVSHQDMQVLGLTCPGKSDPDHECHDVVKGSAPGVASVSKYVAAYTDRFVHAVLETVPNFRNQPVFCVSDDSVSASRWNEVLVVSKANPEDLKRVIKRLHQNLGHPPSHELVRILRHGQATPEAIEVAKNLVCDFCQSQVKPGIPLPAQPNRVSELNHQVGLDVKNLRGWRPNQKIKALNMVDTASGFQRMVPFFETETSSLIQRLFSEHWVAWAGPPRELVLDPAQTNLGDPMVVPCELKGIHIRPIAAGAHWQLGKTESHGGWFAHLLDKIIEEHQPGNKEEWLSCVHHAHIKNQLLQVHGHSPQQFVFGKNIHMPEDVMNEPLDVIPATSSLTDAGLARSQAMRATARIALAKMQDDRAMRVALLARPRKAIEFAPGQTVAYWRDQKWIQGQLHLGGRWNGPAVVIGTVGRNVIVIHRKQLIRCAPEQLRPSTEAEKQLLTTPNSELIGIKHLVEQGKLQSNSYIDLVPQSYLPMADVPSQELEAAGSDMQQPEPVPDRPETPPTESAESAAAPPPLVEPSNAQVERNDESLSPSPAPADDISHETSGSADAAASRPSDTMSYGPIRRRVTGKDGPLSTFRPPAMKQDDFVEVMKEVIPQLIDEAVMTPERDSASKRPVADVEQSSSSTAEPASSRPRTNEVLSVQDCTELLSIATSEPAEALMAEYLKRKMSKELHHSRNPPELQKKVDEGKSVEWQTLLNKQNAIRIHYGKAAERIRQTKADRFIGSRFVLTRKPLEEGQDINADDPETFNVKGRWCLQGHLDPDLAAKAEEGLLKSPTLSQLGRMTLMQILASKHWQLQLGDIKGAFLEAKPLDDRFKPLYAHHPPGGIPGLDPNAVIEIVGNLYGQNDAPAAWFREFSSFVQSIGWIQSKLDPCLFQLRDQHNQLVGIMGVHVDDTALGGQGPLFETAIQKLRQRFPYRKWRIGSGEFCGAWYSQAQDGSISVNMQSFAEKMRSINVPRNASPQDVLSDQQIRVLRAVNGSLNWLSSQTRPDLAVQTSFSQQSFPKPTIQDFRRANQAIRRAKQEKQLGVTFKPINLADLTVSCHSDAAWANVGTHTQAGYGIAFCEKQMQEGKLSSWCPVAWRSYKLSRAVSSTLGAESQAFSVASSTVEWLMLLLAEMLDGPLQIDKCREALSRRKPILITDCKSLCDHLHSPSSPTSIEDRRTSIDVVIIRESVRAMQAFVRWVPTSHMLADALTKDAGDPIDLLRACLKNGAYQISEETVVLQQQAEEKQERLKRRQMKEQEPPGPKLNVIE